jgi:hypothetical protein
VSIDPGNVIARFGIHGTFVTVGCASRCPTFRLAVHRAVIAAQDREQRPALAEHLEQRGMCAST